MKDFRNCVLILDAGSQFYRIVRELFVETYVLPINTSHEKIIENKFRAIIISGSPSSTISGSSFEFDKKIFELGIPVLGICFGMQLMVKAFEGTVDSLEHRADAQTVITIKNSCELYSGLETDQLVLMTHGDSCTNISPLFKINAFNAANVVVSISCSDKKLYGVQFHPEVNLTVNGVKMIENFLFNISDCTPNYTLQNKFEKCIEEIQNTIEPSAVLISLVSGGVDSTVCATLINKALPSNKKYFFIVDHGFLRENEAANVKETLSSVGIDATAGSYFANFSTFVRFPNENKKLHYETGSLRTASNPEHKRQIIGNAFLSIVNKAVSKLNLDFDSCFLVQGTLRPDLIESGSHLVSSNASVIKTHHNDSNFIRKLRQKGRVLEPLKDLHKDEVRALASLLKLPPSISTRLPFPGPGLSIRIIFCEGPHNLGLESKYDIPLLARFIVNFAKRMIEGPCPAKKLIEESLSTYELNELISATSKTSFLNATLLPIMSVGIQGDSRSYKNVIALSSDDTSVDWKSLSLIAKIIPKICHCVNRVVYVIGNKVELPINQITFTFLSPKMINLARKADYIVDTIMIQDNQLCNISQFPVIIIPIHFDMPKNCHHLPMRHSIVLRPFISQDFMTGIPALPSIHIKESTINRINDALLELPGISRILYDLTPKPPGTTEWE